MPTIVGFDFGKHSFRAVEIDRSKKGITLVRAGNYENPKIDIDEEDKSGPRDYANAIKEFVKDSGFATSRVVIGLEEKDVFMRVINVPVMSDKELKSSIVYEAEQYIPIPLKEVNLSFQKLDLPSTPKDTFDVELVAAKKSVIDKYVKLIKEAHLIPVGVEPEAMAVCRSLSSKDSVDSSLIIHLGFDKSIIIVCHKGLVVFTRTLSIGGDAMTRSISQGLNFDYIQAEEYKKTYGLNQDQAEGKIFKVLEPIFANIISEIVRARTFFTSRNTNVNINRVIMSGGTALMPGLLLYMANNLDAEVELANPFKNILFSKEIVSKQEQYIQQGPLFATSVGLALKEF